MLQGIRGFTFRGLAALVSTAIVKGDEVSAVMPVILVRKEHVVRTVLFSFVPKTGGSSLVNFFRGLGCAVFLYNENNPISGLLKCPSQHFHYEILDKILNIERFNFSFSIVRDPIARARSDYLWQFRGSDRIEDLPPFDDWWSTMVDRYARDPYVNENHIRPQCAFVGPKINKVYRFEEGLESIAIDVFASVGFRLKVPEGRKFVPRTNVAESRFDGRLSSADVEVGERARKTLLEFYREDVERFYPTPFGESPDLRRSNK